MALAYGYDDAYSEFNSDIDINLHRSTNLPNPVLDSEPATKNILRKTVVVAVAVDEDFMV